MPLLQDGGGPPPRSTAKRDDFGGALFGTLNNKDSQLNVLIGSRKFTEGWSSWRVSTMGLLNMGQGEGSQIIQLFGRGVRLKGKGFRSSAPCQQERPKGTHLDKLEALNIFGVRANYMATFKDYLREEGITPSDEVLELDFPTRANLPAGKAQDTGAEGWLQGQPETRLQAHALSHAVRNPGTVQGQDQAPPCGA
jgi:hypothetical protein